MVKIENNYSYNAKSLIIIINILHNQVKMLELLLKVVYYYSQNKSLNKNKITKTLE